MYISIYIYIPHIMMIMGYPQLSGFCWFPPSSHSVGHGVHHRGEDSPAQPSTSPPPGDNVEARVPWVTFVGNNPFIYIYIYRYIYIYI